MKRLFALLDKDPKLVVGLMSGTSADGVDAALVHIAGCGPDTDAGIMAHLTQPYPPRLRERVRAAGEGSVADLCRLNFELGERFAEAARAVIEQAGVAHEHIDLVGSHGQTVCHVPRRPGDTASTLQIGEPSVIAERLAIPVVADFRPRDIAAGGHGAPLSAYVDHLLFSHDGPPRALLNLGGIANLTVVGREIEETFAFDAGPANLPLDETVRAITRGVETHDKDGLLASTGAVDENLLQRLLAHPFLARPIPRTTGREEFGAAFVRPLLEGKGARRGVDLLATLTAFSAHCVRKAFDDFVTPRARPVELIVSGGGVHNLTLMGHLRRLFPRLAVRSLIDHGIGPDAKEALIFAVLANETLHGIPNNLPGATGARWPAVLGKVCP